MEHGLTTEQLVKQTARRSSVAQLRQLVGNPNVYAVQRDNGTWYPVREQLTNAVLARHLAKQQTIGTYMIHGDQAKTLVFDVDTDNDSVARDRAGAIKVVLTDLGVPERSIGIEFSGNKGYHVWVPIAQLVPATALRKIGRAVLALAEVDCEVFPKQDEQKDLGSLVKLPSGVHRVSGRENDWVTDIPQPLASSVILRIADEIPEAQARTNTGPPSELTCMHKIQEGVSEGGRNHALFHLAAMLRRAGVNESNTESVVRSAAERCSPPVEDSEVDSVLRSSATSGPICSTIPAELRCEDCPVLRPKGLYAKPGQLRHGAEGELAVVELGKRRANGLIELIHPDLETGLVKPK